jgi:hypothetical protein
MKGSQTGAIAGLGHRQEVLHRRAPHNGIVSGPASAVQAHGALDEREGEDLFQRQVEGFIDLTIYPQHIG